MNSWVSSAKGQPDFSPDSLPFGVFSVAGGERHTGIASGHRIYDLQVAMEAGLLTGVAEEVAKPAIDGRLIGFRA